MGREKTRIKVEPRYVRQKKGLRPFQRETLGLIKNSEAKLIVVEAPVGSGKSHIFRNLIQNDHLQRNPIVFTYPTKILMDSQVEAIKKEFDKVAVWPDDRSTFPIESKGGINILKYSTDSIVKYMKEKPNAFESFKNRGKLIGAGLFDLSYGEHQVFVTTPDVLWLIYSMRYRGARMIQAQLNSALIFFDEFHTYANLHNFYNLLENLIAKSKVNKVILLSATPYTKRKNWSEIQGNLKENQILTEYVEFRNSESDEGGVIFNYPLDVELRNFRYTDRNATIRNIAEILNAIQAPAAIIFDSIFRLKHLKPEIQRLNDEFLVREWSGMKKDDDVPKLISHQEKVLILGTSAIEVGIDMKLITLITESSNWASAIQRIGRVGRMAYLADDDVRANKGYIFLFVNSRDTFNQMTKADTFSRYDFERVLQDSLPDPHAQMIGGELFRGDTYSFVLIDRYMERPVVYSQAIFSMYEVNESQIRNFSGSESDKRNILRNAGIKDEDLIDEVILRDRLVPIWGVIVSEGLRNRYDRILKTEEGEDPENVTIYTESNPAGFHFCREIKAKGHYPEEDLW